MNNPVENQSKPTNQQIKLIHTISSKLDLDERTYRNELYTNFKVRSSKELTYSQANTAIDILRDKAISQGVWKCHPNRKTFKNLGRRFGMATPAQLAYIEHLWNRVSRAGNNEARKKALRSFLYKKIKVTDLRFLTLPQATKVIIILRKMNEQQPKPSESQG